MMLIHKWLIYQNTRTLTLNVEKHKLNAFIWGFIVSFIILADLNNYINNFQMERKPFAKYLWEAKHEINGIKSMLVDC